MTKLSKSHESNAPHPELQILGLDAKATMAHAQSAANSNVEISAQGVGLASNLLILNPLGDQR